MWEQPFSAEIGARRNSELEHIKLVAASDSRMKESTCALWY
jgi:hypothetical protein